MLKAVIVDDEILVLDYLKELLLEQKVEVIGEFTSAKKALEAIPKLRPEIIFLDIEMPGISGIELAAELTGQLPEVNMVFVTAYNQYAVEAFRLNALHYILKPPGREDIVQALERARKTIQKKSQKSSRKEVTASREIYVRLLGRVAIQDDEGNSLLRWPTQKTEEMFVLLMLHGKQGIDKWSMIEKLWPLSERQKIENTMYTTIYRMKKALQEAGIKATLRNRLGQYFFEIEGAWCDVVQLEGIYEAFQKLGEPEAGMEEQLFSIYQGILFGSKDYLWGELQKYAYQNMFDKLCNALIQGCEKAGDLEKRREILTSQQLRSVEWESFSI